MSKPFVQKKRWWLIFPNGTVGHWGFITKERAEFFCSGKMTVIQAETRKRAQDETKS